jgi:hypothetical protein
MSRDGSVLALPLLSFIRVCCLWPLLDQVAQMLVPADVYSGGRWFDLGRGNASPQVSHGNHRPLRRAVLKAGHGPLIAHCFQLIICYRPMF